VDNKVFISINSLKVKENINLVKSTENDVKYGGTVSWINSLIKIGLFAIFPIILFPNKSFIECDFITKLLRIFPLLVANFIVFKSNVDKW
jgi:hypothetical protein